MKPKQNLLQRAGKSMKKAAPTILTCVSAAGVVMTAVLTAKATPKALRCLEEAKTAKNAENGEKLTRMETIGACWMTYGTDSDRWNRYNRVYFQCKRPK